MAMVDPPLALRARAIRSFRELLALQPTQYFSVAIPSVNEPVRCHPDRRAGHKTRVTVEDGSA